MFNRRAFIVSAGALASLPWLPAQAALSRITIGTNPTGTFYNVLGGGLAKLFTEQLGVQATAQPYAGSSVYLPLINNGEVTMGMSSSLDSGGAYRGDQGRDPNRKLRAIARMWPLRYAMLVRKDSDIRNIADVRGKRVVMSFKANVSLEDVHHAALASAGMTIDDVKAMSVAGLPQGMRAVVDGNADATWIAVGIPAVKEAHARVGVRYVDMTGPNFTDEFLGSKAGGVFPIDIKPAANLPEVTEPVKTTGFDVFIVASSDLSNDDATKVLATLYDAYPQLQKDYAPLRLGAQNMLGRPTNTVPYHAAAVAFYKSKGLWTPANDAQEKRLTS